MAEQNKVLILVVVEIGLGETQQQQGQPENNRLNPCCSGNRSRRATSSILAMACLVVLILVVVEIGLGEVVDRHFPMKEP